MKRKKESEVVAEPSKLTLSVNYGDVMASVHADEENYVARITGKMPSVDEWQFHSFIISFVKSIQMASKGGECQDNP